VSAPDAWEEQQRNDPRTGKLGFGLFLASLGMLFAGSLVGYLVIRVQADAWPPPGMPRLPPGLWVSTGLLLISSGTVHWAGHAVRVGKDGMVGPAMAITWGLGLVFLVLQVVNWSTLMAADLTASSNLYGFTFFMLTGLHGVHVIGGLIPMAVVTLKAFRGAYTADSHGGITYSTMYWHFLDGVWLVMFVAMVIAA
jgi:cytochrome c oxidase subunit III